MSLDYFLGLIFFIVIGIPSLLIILELFLGLLPYSKQIEAQNRKACVILMPAHNEELIIENTLSKLKAQLGNNDKIVVIADNCTDKTAEIAGKLGAEVLERFSDTEKGKGYALDFGFKSLADNTPETVVIFDADSEFEVGGLDCLVASSQKYNTAVQGLYLMRSSYGADMKTRVAEFAWMVKNKIRPLGLKLMGLSCNLQGSGMAFPYAVLKKVPLASGNIVEDLELGLNLAKLGHKIRFEPKAIVNSYFPSSDEGSVTQRTRWEHGHLSSIQTLPKMMVASLLKLRFNQFFMALDAAIPPTILWLIILFALSFVTFLGSFLSIVSPFIVAFSAFSGLSFALFCTWFCVGREIIRPTDIGGIITFILSKFSVYKRFFTARQKEWVRTEREGKSNDN